MTFDFPTPSPEPSPPWERGIGPHCQSILLAPLGRGLSAAILPREAFK